MPDTPLPEDPRKPPADLVDRGPVETLAPSRVTIALVAVAGLVVAVLAGVGAVNMDSSRLDEDERLLEEGRHELTAGPVTLSAHLPGDWVARQRCDRWVQLSDAQDDATTLHVVWLDAVPLPSDAPQVDLVATPDDMVTWWREQLDLRVAPLGTTTLDGHTVERHDLDDTPRSRRRDGLVACGEVGGPAATGMFGPAARFDQQVALVEVDDTPLLLVAAAFTGGDPERAGQALEAVLESGSLSVDGG